MNATATLQKFGLEKAFNYIYKDPEKNMLAIMDWKEVFPEEELIYDPLTCSVSTHVGPNAFGMGVSVKLTME